MKHLSLLFATTLIALFFACGGTERATDEPTRGGATTGGGTGAAADGLFDACKTAMTKARECTDEYLPALVDVRIKIDIPAGIKAEAEANGRDALLATAQEEWKDDSTDEAITKQCEQVNAHMPAEYREKNISTSNECAAKDACGDFVTCIMPLHEEMFKMRAAMQAGQPAE